MINSMGRVGNRRSCAAAVGAVIDLAAAARVRPTANAGEFFMAKTSFPDESF